MSLPGVSFRPGTPRQIHRPAEGRGRRHLAGTASRPGPVRRERGLMMVLGVHVEMVLVEKVLTLVSGAWFPARSVVRLSAYKV